MTGPQFVQVVLNALLLSSVYVLAASGLTLLFGIMHLLNFAHGEVYMLGAFVTYYIMDVFPPTENPYVNYLLAMISAIVVCGFLGVLLEKVIFRPLRGRGTQLLIATLGLSLIMLNAGWAVFGTTDKSVSTTIFPGVLEVLGARLAYERVAVIILGVILVAGLYYIVHRTKVGRAMRAFEQDREAATLVGVNIDHVCSISFLIAFALAGLAGVLVAPLFVLNPAIGVAPLMAAFMIIILGGIGNVNGAVVGGIVVGLVESFGSFFFGPTIASGILFVLVILIIIYRPTGILGHA
jgi:branched-chain amino acid transport system permease protein